MSQCCVNQYDQSQNCSLCKAVVQQARFLEFFHCMLSVILIIIINMKCIIKTLAISYATNSMFLAARSVYVTPVKWKQGKVRWEILKKKTRPNSALDVRRGSVSSMCKQSICKVQINRNEIGLHPNFAM